MVYLEANLLKEKIKGRFEKALRVVHGQEEGAVLVEYALLIAGIALALIAAITALYLAIAGAFSKAAAKINT